MLIAARASILSALVVCAAACRAGGQGCSNGLQPGQVTPGTSGSVSRCFALSDQSGQVLYLTGEFGAAGMLVSKHIAKWRGGPFLPDSALVRPSASSPTIDLLEADLGDGRHIYSTSPFARLDIDQWTTLGGPSPSRGSLKMQAVFDDGGGPGLVATHAVSINGPRQMIIWRSETGWQVMGDVWGSNNQRAIAVPPDPSDGPQALYLTGRFDPDDSCLSVAKWESGGWTQVNDPDLSGCAESTQFAASRITGSWRLLMLHGQPNTIVHEIWTFDGEVWSQILTNPLRMLGSVREVCEFDDGNGVALYAAGRFDVGNGPTSLVRLRAGQWEEVPTGLTGELAGGEINSIAGFSHGPLRGLYAGGLFSSIDGVRAWSIARWVDGAWAPLHDGPALSVSIPSAFPFDSGTGVRPHAWRFDHLIDGSPISSLMRWSGSSWDWAEVFIPGHIRAAAINPSDGKWYLSGDFDLGQDRRATVVMFDSEGWQPFDDINPVNGPSRVASVVTFDDGSGMKTYFADADASNSLATTSPWFVSRWTGARWEPVRLRIRNPGEINGSALLLHVMNGQLAAVGNFTSTGPPDQGCRVSRWDGMQWQRVVTGCMNGLIRSAVSHNGGTGDRVYMSGTFTSLAAGVSANGVAVWDGVSLVPIAPPQPIPAGSDRISLFSVNGLSGDKELYATLELGGLHLYRWTTDGWSQDGLPSNIRLRGLNIAKIAGIYRYADGPSDVLMMHGSFDQMGDLACSGIGLWQLCVPCPADYDRSGEVSVGDLFAFLHGWFTRSSAGDFNESGEVTIQDLFDYLRGYIAGCV